MISQPVAASPHSSGDTDGTQQVRVRSEAIHEYSAMKWKIKMK